MLTVEVSIFLLFLRRIQHILDENAIPSRRVVDENVGHRTHQSAVLKNRAAAHE